MPPTTLKIDFGALHATPLPGRYGSGLAYDGTGLFHYDSGLQTMYRLTLAGDVVASFPLADCGCDTDHDGRHLWQSSGPHGGIVVLNPDSGEEIRRLRLPDETSGLCTDGYNWYRGSWKRSDVIRFDPMTGEELGSIPTVGSTSGFAYDGQFLWHGSTLGEQSLLVKIDIEREMLSEQIPLSFAIHGLTFDGRDLLAVDGSNHRLVRIPLE